jgi:hypothetical protein
MRSASRAACSRAGSSWSRSAHQRAVTACRPATRWVRDADAGDSRDWPAWSDSSRSGDAGMAMAAKRAPSTARVRVPEEASAVVHARYEVRMNGRLSERARSAFPAMHVTSVPAQTIVFGELAEPSDLADLLALCSAMGLEVVSLRRLPGEAATRPGIPAGEEAGRASAATPAAPPSRPSDPVESSAARARLERRSGSPPRRCTRQ